MDELKPCPFCKRKELICEHEQYWYRVRCVNCGALGPKRGSSIWAKEEWNDRTRK